MLDSAPLVQFTLGLDVCGMGEFWCLERPEVKASPIQRDLGVPSVFDLVSANQAAAAVGSRASHVLLVDDHGYNSEVGEPVVRLVAVDVVDDPIWRATNDVQPRHSMRSMPVPIYREADVSAAIIASGHGADLDAVAQRGTSSKNARLWIVVQQFAQSLRGKIGLSHDAVLSLIGQRLAGAINAARASLFSRMHHACAMGAA